MPEQENNPLPPQSNDCALSMKGLQVGRTTISWWWILLIILILVAYFKWEEMSTLFCDNVCRPPPGSVLSAVNLPNNFTVNTPTAVRNVLKDVKLR